MIIDLVAKIKKKMFVCFPESDSLVVLKASKILISKKICNILLIGENKYIKSTLNKNKINLNVEELFSFDDLLKINSINKKLYSIDPLKFKDLNKIANEIYSRRKEKGLSLEESIVLSKQHPYFATMLVAMSKISVMISGSKFTTKESILPALKLIPVKKGISKASSFFYLYRKNKQVLEEFFFSDTSLIVDPDSKELSEIAIMTSKSVKNLFNTVPRVAMLSHSTWGSANNNLTKKVLDATNIIKKSNPDLIVEGEIQFDAAVVPWIAEKKCTGSKIKGDANIFIFPNVDSGNISYKIAERWGGFRAIGPITQGLDKIVNVVSRGCTEYDIVEMTIISLIQVETQ